MKNIHRFFNQFDKVICISLADSLERRARMRALFKQIGIGNYMFFDAVDKSSEEVTAYYSEGKVATFPPCFRCKKLSCGNDDCNNVLIPAQVATFLSYKAVWAWLAKSNLSNALLVEDDLVLADNAESRSQDIFNKGLLDSSPLLLNESAYLVRFGWALCEEHALESEVRLETFSRMANPAHAINKKMAAKLLNAATNIDTTVDIFQHNEVANETNSATCFPPLFYELSWSTGEVDSLIHPKQVRLDYLTAHKQDNQLIKDTEKKIQFHNKHVSVYNILGIGHPRCGSGYTASLLNALRLDVGHEELKPDGIVSWMFASEKKAPWAKNEGAQSKEFKHFKYIIHHVRDPRQAIPSIIRDNIYSSASYQFRKNVIKQKFSIDMDSYETHIERAVVSYIFWNTLCLQLKPNITYRVEDQEHLLIDQLKEDDFIASEHKLHNLVSKNVNENKKYKGIRYAKMNIKENDYANINPALLKELNFQCEIFGYRGFYYD